MIRNAMTAHEPIDVLHLCYKYLPKSAQGITELRTIVERCLLDHGISPESAVMSRYDRTE